MGCVIPVDELEKNCQKLYESAVDDTLKDKVHSLFTVMTTEKNQAKREIAQWALTYLFDDEDLIHDNIQGLGLVDDMLVLDKAIYLLDSITTD